MGSHFPKEMTWGLVTASDDGERMRAISRVRIFRAEKFISAAGAALASNVLIAAPKRCAKRETFHAQCRPFRDSVRLFHFTRHFRAGLYHAAASRLRSRARLLALSHAGVSRLN